MQSIKAEGVPPTTPPYIIIIEGREVEWTEAVITTEQLIALGGWEAGQGVIEVDEENNERTLLPGEIIRIREQQSFGKKHKWKRG